MPEYVRRLRELVGGDELLQIPSVSIVLRDSDGRVLLARHSEGDVWLLPGGAIEPAEIPADSAVREMFEETGLLVRLTRLVGVSMRFFAWYFSLDVHEYFARQRGIRKSHEKLHDANGLMASVRKAGGLTSRWSR